MPFPAALANAKLAYKALGRVDLSVRTANPETRINRETKQREANPRANVDKVFFPYLELTMQAKHDGEIRGYLQAHNTREKEKKAKNKNYDSNEIDIRKQDGSQVPSGSTANDFAFYRACGVIAAEICSEKMTEKWQSNQNINNTVFVHGARNDCSVQSETQRDDYSYEVSFYYEPDGIYVVFHCYP